MSTATARRIRESSREESLTTYLQEIGSYPLLDRDAEILLGRRIRAGDARAVQELVCANLRFVVLIAKKYQHQGVTLPDLINEGNVGLMRAAERFDETKGVKFISYAVWWVRQAIVQSVAETGHAVRVPVSRAGALYRVNRRANTLRHELGREPTTQELAASIDVDEAVIATTMPVACIDLSLDASANDGDETSLLDYMPDPGGPSADEEALGANLADSVAGAFEILMPRETQILRLYFGFDGNDAMTLESIGDMLGITREPVRQIKERALRRLRGSRYGEALASFADR